MLRRQAPLHLLQLLVYVHVMEGWTDMTVDMVEWMCGVGRVEEAFSSASYHAIGFDRDTRDPLQDILLPHGLLLALSIARQCKFKSFHDWGTLCSSWVWVARSVSGRTYINPSGDSDHWFASEGNIMVARMILICLFLLARLAVVHVEQPGTTMMNLHPRWQFFDRAAQAVNRAAFLALCGGPEQRDEGVVCVPTWMGSFGANHAKRTLLWCTKSAVVFPLHRVLTSDWHLIAE